MKCLRFFLLLIIPLSAYTQDTIPAYGIRAEFSARITHRTIDTIHNTITIRSMIFTPVITSFRKKASPSQRRLILRYSSPSGFAALRESDIGSWAEDNHIHKYWGEEGIISYILESKYKLSADTFRLIHQDIVKSIPGIDSASEEGSTAVFLPDSAALDSARAAIDQAILPLIPEGHVLVQLIRTDIDGDHRGDLIIGSAGVIMHGVEPPSFGMDMAERSMQVYRGTAHGYEKLWEDTGTPFASIDIISFKGQKRKAIMSSADFCYRECSSNIVIYMQGNSKVTECRQMLP